MVGLKNASNYIADCGRKLTKPDEWTKAHYEDICATPTAMIRFLSAIALS